MHIHVLGICGTFMGGLALLAREAGHRVTGSDAGVYPPMSDMLEREGIPVHAGYDPASLDPAPDRVVVGNALARGNPCVEHVLDQGLAFSSGPQWLAEEVLHERWVIAVAGTHGKTTTASAVAWILDQAGLEPGFLIGGIPGGFGVSARLGRGPFFVVEADEYDSAFFDKRAKFVHFRPRTLVINNIEFDHADIYDDLAAIRRQFHHLVRTVPGAARIIANGDDPEVARTLAMGCWTPVETFGCAANNTWRIQARAHDTRLRLAGEGTDQALDWPMPGLHNACNATAALLAARHAGVPLAQGLEVLARFPGIRRRLELRGEAGGVQVYDDFAHHPTAIAATIAALRPQVRGRILAVTEPRSNTMRTGVHRDTLAAALDGAERMLVLQPADLPWDLAGALKPLGGRASTHPDVPALVAAVAAEARPGDAVLVMSNGGFDGIHGRLLAALETAPGAGA